MSALPKCTLCANGADPRTGLLTPDGYFPLCDGCAPYPGEESAVADRCRASGAAPSDTALSPFGHNEQAKASR